MTTGEKKKNRIVNIAIVLSGLLLVTVVLLFLYKGRAETESRITGGTSLTGSYKKIEADGKTYQYNADLISVLVLGVDAKESSMLGQTDSDMLVIFDRANKKIKIVSISRDSMVPIQLFDASGKKLGLETQHLGLAYSYGKTPEKGALLTSEAVSRMFGNVPIVYYAAANISAIPIFHSLVGELTITLPDDSLQYLDERYKAGTEMILTADNVEEFVRSRNIKENYSNDQRMERQRIYITAYMEKLKILLNEDFSSTLSKMNDIFPNTSTNISINEIVTFAEMALNYTFDGTADYYNVEGTSQTGMFHDEYIVDEEALEDLKLKLFYKEK